MNKTKTGFKLYFDKLIKAWNQRFGSRPKTPFEDELDAELLVSNQDAEGFVEWLPQEVVDPFLSNEIGDCYVADAVIEYFDAYRFLEAGGKFRGTTLQLSPVTTSFLVEELPRRLAAYREIHGGKLCYVPIGIETTRGNLVVLANSNENGGVYAEDVETFELKKLAENLYQLLSELEP